MIDFFMTPKGPEFVNVNPVPDGQNISKANAAEMVTNAYGDGAKAGYQKGYTKGYLAAVIVTVVVSWVADGIFAIAKLRKAKKEKEEEK